MIIKLSSTSKTLIENLFLTQLSFGAKLIRAYYTRKFIMFGKKKYYIEMEKNNASIPLNEQLKTTIAEERYEDAAKFHKMLNS